MNKTPFTRLPVCLFLTGATGFLGKVVLEELLRRKEELGVKQVVLLIRPKKELTAKDRFEQQIKKSPCFEKLPKGWFHAIKVVEGDLSLKDAGMSMEDRQWLEAHTHHIIHCAASVEFDLPMRQAAISNIQSSLNMLDIAKKCRQLRNMVSVSTAYVTPHHAGKIFEELVPLPCSASKLYQEIFSENFNEKNILHSTGHPNTYTFTKCLAEHLLWERKEHVKLAIVRPSIISASRCYPMPGWIDSQAALAAFIVSVGGGVLKVMCGRSATYLDVVPVDEVCHRLLSKVFDDTDLSIDAPTPNSAMAQNTNPFIVHAVAGISNSYTVSRWSQCTTDFYNRYPLGGRSALHYIGPINLDYHLQRLCYHVLPLYLLGYYYQCINQPKKKKIMHRILSKIDYINDAFPYFTSHTFDFQSSMPLTNGFDVVSYVKTVNRGIYSYLLKKNPHNIGLAGKEQPAPWSDFFWALSRYRGNVTMRCSAAILSKVLRRIFDRVSFDQSSFEKAFMDAKLIGPIALLPNHRSYIDFLILSYLFFARHDLGIGIPYVAAAKEFSKIPLVGALLKQMHAFYLTRGQGKACPQLTQTIEKLVSNRQNIQFFIEGERSRSRRFLWPKRGLMRALQRTDKKFALLPISLSYDKVPEERAFIGELAGEAKPAMTLSGLLGWSWRMLKGEVKLGNLSIRCGEVIAFDSQSDVHQSSLQVMASLQANQMVSRYHLQYFVRHELTLESKIDIAWLCQMIKQRGGLIQNSGTSLKVEDQVETLIAQTYRKSWEHLFIQEAVRLQPRNLCLQHYQQVVQFMAITLGPINELYDPKMLDLLKILFQPVCEDYGKIVYKIVDLYKHHGPVISHHDLFKENKFYSLDHARLAVDALCSKGLIDIMDAKHYVVRGSLSDLQQYRTACRFHYPLYDEQERSASM